MSPYARRVYATTLLMVTGFAFLSRLTQIAPPSTRFVFLGAEVRLGLPSHPASRRRSCLRLGVSTTSSSRGLPPPIDRPCRAYSSAPPAVARTWLALRYFIAHPVRPACCARPSGRARAGGPDRCGSAAHGSEPATNATPGLRYDECDDDGGRLDVEESSSGRRS